MLNSVPTVPTQTDLLCAPACAARITDEGGAYSVVLSTWLDAALAECRGSYQTALVRGHEALSGATLQGEAKRWGKAYGRSRNALLARLTDADIPWCEGRARRGGRRILVIGTECLADVAWAVAGLGGWQAEAA